MFAASFNQFLSFLVDPFQISVQSNEHVLGNDKQGDSYVKIMKISVPNLNQA